MIDVGRMVTINGQTHVSTSTIEFDQIPHPVELKLKKITQNQTTHCARHHTTRYHTTVKCTTYYDRHHTTRHHGTRYHTNSPRTSRRAFLSLNADTGDLIALSTAVVARSWTAGG